jgi:hypothetical protein
MTGAEWCLFGAVLLYLVTLAPTKGLAPREFDNANPRDPKFFEHPVRKRALGAHINGIETFPFFAAAVLLAEFRNAPQGWVDGLALRVPRDSGWPLSPPMWVTGPLCELCSGTQHSHSIWGSSSCQATVCGVL